VPAENSKNRIILRRSNESRVLRGIGIAAYFILLTFLVLAFANRWDSEIRTNLLLWALFLLPVLLVYIRDVFRRIVLLDGYISYTSWYGTPRVRSYDEISTIETVVIDEERIWRWERETFVRITFNDGRSLKVHKGLMSVAKFRKLLQQRAGRKLMNSSKRKKS
jgi:hypothetical protein